MKKINDQIKTFRYISYIYDTIEEKNNHIIQMHKDGYENLTDFEDKLQTTYRKIDI